MNRALIQRVRKRAREVCEYCRMPQLAYRARFEIDHIVAQHHGGATNAENLALACQRCNAHKGPNIAGIDPLTGQLVRLFHPRQDRWTEHFEWSGAQLVGRTPIRRVTVLVLAINDPLYVLVRKMLMAEGLFPPPE